MANKISLSMLRGKAASSPAPLMAFRFNTAEEDIEELPYDTKDTLTREKSAPALALPEEKTSPSCASPIISDPSDKTELHCKDFAVTQEEMVGIAPNLEAESYIYDDELQSMDSSKKMSLEGRDAKYSFHHEGRDSKDPSPMKESVKDYFAKLGKRSLNLDGGPGTEYESRSLLSEIKGRWTKTREDKNIKEISNFGVNATASEKSRKGSEITPEEYKTYSSEIESGSPINIYSNVFNEESLANIADDSFTLSVEEKSESSEEMQNEEKKQASCEFEEFETAKCVLSKSSSPNLRRTSQISASSNAQGLISPKRVTLSSLMASNGLESEFFEEEEIKISPDKNSAEIQEKVLENTPLYSQQKLPSESIYTSFLRVINLHWRKLYESIWKKYILSISVTFLACFIAPFPPYFSGLIMGMFLSFAVGTVVWWVFRPPKPHQIPALPDFSKLPPLVINHSTEDKEPVIYSGWMNELPTEYNPENYHISNTHSVYVRLDGTSLRLSYPKTNIQKRAMWNEPRHEAVFLNQKHYDISGATVSLLPKGLARKRLWSKKYPLCLVIPKRKSTFILPSENKNIKESPKEDLPAMTQTTGRSPGSKESSPVRKTFPKNVDDNSDVTLCLFSRTDREKDEWFRRFQQASKEKAVAFVSSQNIYSKDNNSVEHKRVGLHDLNSIKKSSSYSDTFEDEPKKESNKIEKTLDFNIYMASLLQKDGMLLQLSPSGAVIHSKDKKCEINETKGGTLNVHHPAHNLLWLNALIGRCFYDFLTVDIWSKAVANKIQRKLSKIRLPYFMEELSLADINLGTSLPQIHRASEPVLDQRGLWVDLDISYSGSFLMTLETKLNLLRLKKTPGVEMTMLSNLNKETESISSRSHLYNSDEEDSAESSSDDDVPLPDIQEHSGEEEPMSPSSGGSKSRRLLRLVDKIAQSRYFQQATEYKCIKKVMKEVSNTPLLLTVEVHWLSGTLSLNIPPLPTDRLWYGFRNNPQLSIVARPKLGGRVVTITHVTEWIEKKLALEFQKLLVMPNMDDLIIPIMDSGCSVQRS